VAIKIEKAAWTDCELLDGITDLLGMDVTQTIDFIYIISDLRCSNRGIFGQ